MNNNENGGDVHNAMAIVVSECGDDDSTAKIVSTSSTTGNKPTIRQSVSRQLFKPPSAQPPRPPSLTRKVDRVRTTFHAFYDACSAVADDPSTSSDAMRTFVNTVSSDFSRVIREFTPAPPPPPPPPLLPQSTAVSKKTALLTPRHRHSRSIVIFSPPPSSLPTNTKALARVRWRRAFGLVRQINRSVKSTTAAIATTAAAAAAAAAKATVTTTTSATALAPPLSSPPPSPTVNNNNNDGGDDEALAMEKHRFIDAIVCYQVVPPSPSSSASPSSPSPPPSSPSSSSSSSSLPSSEWRVKSSQVLAADTTTTTTTTSSIPPNIDVFAMSVGALWRPPRLDEVQFVPLGGDDNRALTKTAPNYFHLVLTDAAGDRLYACVLHFYQATADTTRPFMMTAHSVVILSHYGFLAAFRQCLRAFYDASGHMRARRQPRALLMLLSATAFLPNMGLAGVELRLAPHLRARYAMPGHNQFPLLDLELTTSLFAYLSMDVVVSVYVSLLLERSIVLVSDHVGRLGDVSECLLALLFPLKWLHVYVSVLPVDLLDYVDAPVSFFVGVHRANYGKIRAAALTNVLVVDIDRNEVVTTTTCELPRLPSKLEFALKSSLQTVLTRPSPSSSSSTASSSSSSSSSARSSSLSSSPHERMRRQHDIRMVFLNSLCTLLCGYRKHMFFMGEGRVPIFNANSFLADSNMRGERRAFLSKFLATQLFVFFLEDSDDHDTEFHEALSNGCSTKTTHNIVYGTAKQQAYFPVDITDCADVDADTTPVFVEWTNMALEYQQPTTTTTTTMSGGSGGVYEQYQRHSKALLMSVTASPDDGRRRSTLMPARRRSSRAISGDNDECNEFEDAVAKIFLGEQMTPELQEMAMACLESSSTIRRLFVSLMGERQSMARICLRARSLSMLRHLVRTLITAAYSADEMGHIQSVLRSCARYYFKRVDTYVFLDSWIDHALFRDTVFWQRMYALELQLANDTKDLVTRCGSLIQDQLTYGRGVREVAAFIAQETATQIDEHDRNTLLQLTRNIATALEATKKSKTR